MASWIEAASGTLTLLAFWSAFPRYSDLGVIQEETYGSIVISPNPMTVPGNATAGTVIGTLSVQGGAGTYTYVLTDPSGYFVIVGNQIETATTPIPPGNYNVLITATGSTGDVIQLPTTIYVTPGTGTYVPTYLYYGF